MADRLEHRGPDAGGTWADERVALGHRRLSILDRGPSGAQPMADASGRYVIAYNGEIYNHLELREALARDGAAPEWQGHSDTETLLAAIAHFGLDETLKRSAGMFALALWDQAEQTLSLARDRMGEKPLYWGMAGQTLLFGSELKALRLHPDFEGKLCSDATALYLRYAYVPAPFSIYRGIFKLEPGTILSVGASPPGSLPDLPLRPGDEAGTLAIRRYWSLNETIDTAAAEPLSNEAEALDLLHDTLSAAVRRQLISDVPIGAFLSGGVDSSTIVALMQAQSDRPVRTFTIAFDNPAFDESPFAGEVARHLGTEHHVQTVSETDARDVIPLLPEIYDEPFADHSQIPTYLVCKAARETVTVVHSGDAGDELFGGYNRYLWGPPLWRRFERFGAAGRGAIAKAIDAIPATGWDAAGGLYSRHRSGAGGIAFAATKAQRLATSLRKTRNFDDFYDNLISRWPDPAALVIGLTQEASLSTTHPLPDHGMNDLASRMMIQDMRGYLPGDILCKVDRAAMAVSLETRVPFLDPDVISLAARLPLDMKVRGGTGKWALRQVLYRYVPRELIERPKVGFSIPLGEWLRTSLRDWAEDLLSAGKLDEDGILDSAPIRQAWAEHLSGRRDWADRLWIILMFQAWRQGQK
jgi:asparagine synthase (glutamine-hydrolysing)